MPVSHYHGVIIKVTLLIRAAAAASTVKRTSVSIYGVHPLGGGGEVAYIESNPRFSFQLLQSSFMPACNATSEFGNVKYRYM